MKSWDFEDLFESMAACLVSAWAQGLRQQGGDADPLDSALRG